jgi:hypothetical protein
MNPLPTPNNVPNRSEVIVGPSLVIASFNLVIDEPARETAVEVESVGLVEPGDVPVVFNENFGEHGVNVADAFDASAQGSEVLLEDVERSLGV